MTAKTVKHTGGMRAAHPSAMAKLLARAASVMIGREPVRGWLEFEAKVCFSTRPRGPRRGSRAGVGSAASGKLAQSRLIAAVDEAEASCYVRDLGGE